MAEVNAVAAEEVSDAVAGEMLRALEQHVLREVGYSAFVVLLDDGTRLDQQVEERHLLRFVVAAHVVGQSVGQHSLAHRRIFRNHLFVNLV